MALPHRFWLCWVNQNDNVFVQDYAVNQEVGLAWEFIQVEGDFAQLQVTIQNTGVPPLSAGRKRWAWFSFDDGPSTSATPIFFGQIVAVPGSLHGPVITYALVGRPYNYDALKKVAADALRVLPWYDKAFIDRQSWDDDDLVLEARAALYYTDPITHSVSTSHVLVGEAGVIEFEEDEHTVDDFDLTFGSAPIHTAEVSMEMSWTQQGTGVLDLTDYIVSNWPNNLVGTARGAITSFTINDGNWFRTGASLKDGWSAVTSEALPVYDLTIKSKSEGSKLVLIWPPDEITVDFTSSTQYSDVPPGSYGMGLYITASEHRVTYSPDDDPGPPTISSISTSQSWTTLLIPLYHTKIKLVAGWEASRPYTETAVIRMTADMQPVITMPDQSQVLKLQPMRSVNLSEPLDPDNYEGPPIGDSRYRSYVTRDRGRQSLMHGALKVRAAILNQSRAARVEMRCLSLNKWATVTLRHNVLVHCPKIPSSDTRALGKVIERRASFSDGILSCSLVLGCSLGRGGTVVEVEGVPEYCEEAYVAKSEDYQQYIGEELFVGEDSDLVMGFPLFDPQDDGLDLISGLDVEKAIAIPLSVENTAAEQKTKLDQEFAWITHNVPNPANIIDLGFGGSSLQERVTEYIRTITELATTALNEEAPTTMTFALKSMKGAFRSDYVIETGELKIPKMLDLET